MGLTSTELTSPINVTSDENGVCEAKISIFVHILSINEAYSNCILTSQYQQVKHDLIVWTLLNFL